MATYAQTAKPQGTIYVTKTIKAVASGASAGQGASPRPAHGQKQPRDGVK